MSGSDATADAAPDPVDPPDPVDVRGSTPSLLRASSVMAAGTVVRASVPLDAERALSCTDRTRYIAVAPGVAEVKL